MLMMGMGVSYGCVMRMAPGVSVGRHLALDGCLLGMLVRGTVAVDICVVGDA